jgi:V-type H+-transporting ATPase subunit a
MSAGYFQAQMEKGSIPMRSIYEFNNVTAAASASEIDELVDRTNNLENRISSLNESYETLKRREVELTEWRWVLREAGSFFDRVSSSNSQINKMLICHKARGNTEEIRQSIDASDDAPLLQDLEQHTSSNDVQAERSLLTMNIGFVAGTIPRERIAAFERILWRTLRGNLYMNQSEIEQPIIDPETNEGVNKNVFVIFAHGKEIIAKIRKISESLGANLYSVDENTELRRDQVHDVNTRLGDLDSVLRNTENTLSAELTAIGRSLAMWMVIVRKEKAVYETLNKFSYDQARKTLIAEAWSPTNSLGLIKSTLQDVNDRAGLSVPTIVNTLNTSKTPPTYVKTNKFTLAFQTIIDAYGTAKYQEVNPGLPTLVTFPFLFAVMFGDFGHGTLMTLAALAMIYFEKRLSRSKLDELFSMAFYGRYIMLMMGIFSMYTGLIYCDAFSKDIPLFKSMWEWPQEYKDYTPIQATRVKGYTYPFGLDWKWHETENDLLFSNSYKMKLSILLGWAHMTFSLCLSYVNARHFKTPIDIWGNFIPGMIFFQSIFGYLVFCIVYKWSQDWYGMGLEAPGLLNMLIYMFLSPGTIEAPLYRGQATIQVMLLMAAGVCVPILLFLKPFYLRYEHNKARALGYRGIGENTRVSALDDDDDDEGQTLNGGRESIGDDHDGAAMITQDIHGEHEEFEFSEVMIHQVIHTIGK